MPLIKSVSGIRGIVDPACGQPVTLTPEVARDMGRAFATYLARGGVGDSARRTLIGSRDGRPGGQVYLDAFAQGAWDCGALVIPSGVVSTPGTALAVAENAEPLGVAGGVVITASHNPQQWNGIKLLMGDGRAPTASEAAAVFDLFDRRDFDAVNTSPPPAPPPVPDIHQAHVARVLKQVDCDAIRAHGFRVMLDSINGAGAQTGRMLLERLGCTVQHVNDQPGSAFGRSPEPTAENLQDFCATVAGADVAVAFVQDPDADRLAILDNTGRYIGEEYTLALAARHVFANNPGPAVANLSTSRMIDDLAAAAGAPCVVHRSAVGEANVVETMRRVSAHVGGEGNGGVIDPRVVYVRDSLISMALVLQLMADEDRRLSRIVDQIPRYAIVKEKLEVDHPRIARILTALKDAFADQRINDLDGLRIDWPDRWVHVRASNTEPIMRLIAEATDEQSALELIAHVRVVVDATL
ncbi:MAG TPA: phosphoglucosamine mutase [Phycisphaerae bacterium]|nr:phosphoglucosamine mutase [Phycisphaerae bacterium]